MFVKLRIFINCVGQYIGIRICTCKKSACIVIDISGPFVDNKHPNVSAGLIKDLPQQQ